MEMITVENAREAVWRILNSLGYSEKHNDRLVEEVDAVLDEYAEHEESDWPSDAELEMGFDPYQGCYTDDC